MTFKELKKYCDERIKKYPALEKKYKKEIIYAKRFYNNDINLVDLLKKNATKIKSKYVIPFLLKLTDEVKDEEWEYKYVKSGSSGGKHQCLPLWKHSVKNVLNSGKLQMWTILSETLFKGRAETIIHCLNI